MAEETKYTEDNIRSLDWKEHIRMRPGMYIGGTDERALHHLVAEILDNSMDEAVAGHATRIEIELTSDYFMIIKDNGRGIPVGIHEKEGVSALQVLSLIHI